MEPKKPWLQRKPKRLHQYWRTLFKSTNKRMTRGSWNISKIVSWARGDNWRRGREKKK